MTRRIMKITASSILGVTLIAIVSVFSFTPKLVWNGSQSAPIGLYRIVDRAPILHEYALVEPSEVVAKLIEERGYLPPNTPLIKRVAAHAGDEICRQNERISINKTYVAEALLMDSFGRAMPQWNGCFALQSGEIFLLNAHEKSLDGRYFGVTKSEQVVGVAVPVWVRVWRE